MPLLSVAEDFATFPSCLDSAPPSCEVAPRYFACSHQIRFVGQQSAAVEMLLEF
jgi:hypothetical protein